MRGFYKFTIFFYLCATLTALAETKISAPEILGSEPYKTFQNSDGKNNNLESDRFIMNSLIFNAQESRMLAREHSIYRRMLISNEINDMGGINSNKRMPDIPAPEVKINQIYLSSVMYAPNGESVAWINNQKYKKGDSNNDITLVDVQGDSAKITWDLSKYRFNFNDPKIQQQKTILADNKSKTLTFTLKPNTRLSVAEMKILSGKTYRAPVKKIIASKAAGINDAEKAIGNDNNGIGINNKDQAEGKNSNLAIPEKSEAEQGDKKVIEQKSIDAKPVETEKTEKKPAEPEKKPEEKAVYSDLKAAELVNKAKAAKTVPEKINIANELRSNGRPKEADEVDNMIRQINPNYKKLPSGAIKLKDIGATNSMTH